MAGTAFVFLKNIRARWLEWTLLAIGALGISYCLATGVQMARARTSAAAIGPEFSRPEAGGSSEETATSASFGLGIGTGAASVGRPAVIGRVEIPAIGLVTPLLAGDDSMSLTEGAGHIPGTAVPGGLGTVGIAGHRDTHFRLLSKVKPGMEVRLISGAGVYHYRVTSFEIVAPEQVSVLATRDVPGLALVTCYPFQFIGHAPQRFIVHAELVSVAADR